MSVKNTEHVNRYAANVADILSAIDNLREFVESLPAPDDANELPTLHYGHTGTVAHLREMIGEAVRVTEGFYK